MARSIDVEHQANAGTVALVGQSADLDAFGDLVVLKAFGEMPGDLDTARTGAALILWVSSAAVPYVAIAGNCMASTSPA
jgi:hypothetical protein